MFSEWVRSTPKARHTITQTPYLRVLAVCYSCWGCPLSLVKWSTYPVESTEGISEIWFREPFPGWGFLRFRVRVRFIYR